MTRPRDSQRGKVFTAESTLGQSLKDSQAIKLADTVTWSGWWRMHADGVLLERDCVLTNATHCCATLSNKSRGGDRYIRIPRRFAVQGPVNVMHALTHLIVPDDVAWHGPEFCKMELELVGKVLGKAPQHELRSQFKANRVKLRVVSQEARDAARERWYLQKGKTLEDDLENLLRGLE